MIEAIIANNKNLIQATDIVLYPAPGTPILEEDGNPMNEENNDNMLEE